MTIQDAKNRVKEVVESAKDYQTSIKALQKKIIEYSEELTSAFNSVGNEINENSIVNYSNRSATQIISTLSNILDLTNSTLNILSSDANKRIREIVDEYNSSLPQESREPRLTYYEVALAGIAGSVTAYQPVTGGETVESSNESIDTSSEEDNNDSSSDETNSTKTSSSGGGYSNNYYGGGGSYASNNYDWNMNNEKKKNGYGDDEDDELPGDEEPRTETDETINQYIEMLETKDGVKSVDIYDWEDLMKKFLKEHGLDTYVDKLELEENYVKCTLLNNKKYKISNISSVEESLRAIDKILEREELK